MAQVGERLSGQQALLAEIRARGERAHTPGAVSQPARGVESCWIEVPADEFADAVVQSMAINGVDYLFFSSGSDIGFYQEAIVKARVLGRPAPRLLNMLHENANLNAAIGYALVSHRPAATAAHVELGTLNYGGAIHNAWRNEAPILMTAGMPPLSYGRSRRGGRDQAVFWPQELYDYGQIVRQYVKWDHVLNPLENPGLVVSRALQLALAERQGPTYLVIPRDVAMLPLEGLRFPSIAQLGLPDPPSPDPDAVRTAARLLVEARNPLVLPRKAGRTAAGAAALRALCELLALPVAQAPRSERMNLPTDHPLCEAGPPLDEADVILVVDNDTPWLPGIQEPHPDAKIIWLAIDPIQSRFVNYEFPATLHIAADTAKGLTAIAAEAERLLSAGDRSRIADRFERCRQRHLERRAALERAALAAANQRPISPKWLSYQLGQVLDETCILLEDTVGNAPNVQNYCPATQPESFFRNAGASGGWGVAAGFGAKLAAPDKTVVVTTGDGFFLYSVPYAALWAAVKYQAPFLTVVYQNLAYSTGTTNLKVHYPEGYSLRTGDFEGGLIDPPPDLAKLAESVGAYGENVTDPAAVGPALRRALAIVRDGTPAVVAVRLPQLMVETQERA
ncbi:MAG TPA: thiamine pyrophosphate-requiring protein [Chloroflexota bacterium]|nr:thiamine pyrophosphate-requiring protein [Chloroflexota bacterium]